MGLQERTKARQRRAFATTERMPGRAMPSRHQRRQPDGLPPESVEKSENLSSTGRKGVCGKPGKGVLHDDDPHFSELSEVLKNASACRKGFFDTLTGRKHLLPACFGHQRQPPALPGVKNSLWRGAK